MYSELAQASVVLGVRASLGVSLLGSSGVSAEARDRLSLLRPEETEWPVILAIVGSRSFDDYGLVRAMLRGWLIDSIVSGGASGADELAERYARERGVPLQVLQADWRRYGRSAGYRRNVEIVKAADQVVAFWDGESPGTRHTIKTARAHGKPVTVVDYEERGRIPH